MINHNLFYAKRPGEAIAFPDNYEMKICSTHGLTHHALDSADHMRCLACTADRARIKPDPELTRKRRVIEDHQHRHDDDEWWDF